MTREHSAALGLVAAVLVVFYSWALVPPTVAGQWWNICGALARIGLLVALLWHSRGWVLLAGAWWVAEDVMVAGCSAAFMVRPWPVAPGEAQCSALLGYDLGSLGVVMGAGLAWLIVRRSL